MIDWVKEKISNLFKVTTVISIDDTGNVQRSTSTFLGKRQTTMSASLYGHFGNPPPNSIGLTFAQEGKESSLISLIDSPDLRPKNLVVGETGVSNYITGDILKFESIGIVSLVTFLLSITGNLAVSGDIEAANVETTVGMVTPLIVINGIESSTHTHVSAAPGSPTGQPQ